MNGFDILNEQYILIFAGVALLLVTFSKLQEIIASLVQFLKILPVFSKLTSEQKKWVYPLLSFIVGVLFAIPLYVVFWTFTPELNTVIKVVVGVIFIVIPGLSASGYYDLQKITLPGTTVLNASIDLSPIEDLIAEDKLRKEVVDLKA